MDTNLEARLRDFLDRQYGLKYDKPNDCWYGEIYADYRDEFDDRTLKEIFKDDHPRDEAIQRIEDAYSDASWDYQDELLDEFQHEVEDDFDWDAVEDEVDEFIREHVHYDPPFDHFMKQTIQVDIIVDTGDGNYDFVLNCVYPHYNGDIKDEIEDRAALTWLAKQQGYTKEQLQEALHSGHSSSKFLSSVFDEVANCTSHMNALAFFMEMTLEECLELQEKIAAADQLADSYIVLSKDTRCGLYDSWSGAGSMLEIVLDIDVELPLHFISSAKPDGCRGYGVDEIYGMCRSFWGHGGIIAVNVKDAA